MSEAESTPPPVDPQDAVPREKRRRRPNVLILLTFLGAFLLLLIVFREVLFPFLMAIFLAYLVEPVVLWVKRSRLFGIKWARGPIIVLVYIFVIGGLGFLAWKGLTKAATEVRTGATKLSRALKQQGARAVFRLEDETGTEAAGDTDGPTKERRTKSIIVPQGTRLTFRAIRPGQGEATPAVRTYTTLHDVRIPPGENEATVILDREGDNRKPIPPPEEAEDTVDPLRAGIAKYDDGKIVNDRVLTLSVGEPAKGAEVLFEREVLGPVLASLRKIHLDFEPGDLRNFIQIKAAAYSEDLPNKVAKGAVKVAGTIVVSLYEFLLILMITAFLVMDRKEIASFFSSLPPQRYKSSYESLVQYIDRGLSGVIRGQLVICLVNGVLTYLGLLLLGVPYAVVLACVAAVLSLIPVFGTIASSIPIVLIAATVSVTTGVLALAWIALIHLLEANLLNPLIMGSNAHMHPVIIIFALLAGEHSFGVWGALLAVPTMSIIQSCFLFYLHEIEGLPKKAPPPHGGGFGGFWAKVKSVFGKKEATA